MFTFPDTEKKLKTRITGYRSALNKEKKEFGSIHDGSGKRYLLFYLYFILNDLDKSKEYFQWYKNEFPDDSGEPEQKLCWAVSLHRMKEDKEARRMLADLMISNLYIIPYLLGKDVQKYDIWHPSNYADIDFIDDIAEEITENIKESDTQWISSEYDSFIFSRIRNRHIEIFHDLQYTKDLEERKKLVKESFSLLDILDK